jgi:8-oxo-dGTP pyrophosphatase MutT (NUDIX family)
MTLKITKRELLHEGAWLNMRRTTFVNDAKIEGRWEFIASKKGDIAGIIAFTDENKAVLIKQYRVPMEAYVLQLPAGFIDPADESPETSAKRELLEETGYAAERVVSLGIFPFSAGLSNMKMHLFVGFNAKKIAEPTHEAEEDIEVLIMSKEEILSYNKNFEDMLVNEQIFSSWVLAENVMNLE